MEMLTEQSCQNLSLLSSESSEDDLSVSCYTESSGSSRRSPRLLSNGYYVHMLSEDSILFGDEGTISPFASQTNISYKEKVVRVFNRRKRRPFRSLASVLAVREASKSILEENVPDGMAPSLLTSSPWMESRADRDSNAIPTHPEKTARQTWQKGPLHCFPLDKEACFSQEEFSHSLSGFLDITPQFPFDSNRILCQMKVLSDSKIQKAVFLVILLICIFSVVFSWWILGGLAVACVSLILTSFFLTNSTLPTAVSLHTTEEITPKRE